MVLILLNLQSNEHINLDSDSPLIIGRGNIPKCSDKRISRNHAKITCTEDGKLHVVALHNNPCFFLKNGVPPVHQLNKNEEQILSKEDCIGLLPDSFWFKITSNKEVTIKSEINATNGETNCSSTQENINCVISRVLIEEKALKNEEHYRPNLVEPSSSSTLSCSNITSKDNEVINGISPDLEKTKRLPLWMYEIDEPKQCKKSSNKREHDSNEYKDKKLKCFNSAEKPDVLTVKKELETITLESPSTSYSRLSEKASPESHSESKSVQVEENVSSRERNQKEGYESDVSEPSSVSVKKRQLCPYEGNCYRKNVEHKLEFSHPGDSDFTPYEDRPLCQYGKDCYRKNPIHRVEYRHLSQSSTSLSTVPSFSGSSTPTEVPASASSNLDITSSSSSLFRLLSSSSSEKPFPPYTTVDPPLPPKRRCKTVKQQNFNYSDEEKVEEEPFLTDASDDEFIVDSNYESEDSDSSS